MKTDKLQDLLNLENDTIIQLKKRINDVVKDIKTNGIRTYDGDGFTGRKCLSGYYYNEFYDWDLYFENIFMSYFSEHKYCRNGVELFLDQQLENGFISRSVILKRNFEHFKPFLAQISLMGSVQSKSTVWLEEKYYNSLKKYLDYWFWYCDYDKNGLPVWEDAGHTGLDNQFRRAGVFNQRTVEGVDLACYLYRELLAMSRLAELLNRNKDIQSFQIQAEKLKILINKTFWDEESGFYYDRDERKDCLIKAKSASAFTVLWAGIAPPERAVRLIEEHLLNPQEFWLEYPVASWSKSEPDYYQGRKLYPNSDVWECSWMGTTWIPLNYMIFHGLKEYGYQKEASELAQKTFNMVLNEDVTREYYNAENGCGMGLNPFWGWSALAYFMTIEDVLNMNPTDIHNDEYRAVGKEFFGLEF